jgi:GntR family transcriptional regulator, arabinose operon transcriptional repressor
MTVKTKKRNLPKYRVLQEKIIKAIKAGRYPVGGKLPVGREMAKMLDASYVTVNSAMRGLEEQGYVRRVHGSGVFVTDPLQQRRRSNTSDLKQVGALMPMRGDLFQNFSECLVHELEPHNCFLSPLATTGLLDHMSNQEREQQIAKFSECHFDALIIDGNRHVPYRALHKYRDSFNQITFVMHNECGIDFPDTNTVAGDYVQAGYLAAKKLLEAGRKKIALVTFEPLLEMTLRQNGSRRPGYDYEMIDGAEKAFEEAGMPFANNFDIIHDMMIQTPTVRTEALAAKFIKRGFDGFICVGDCRAQHVYLAAAELNMVPGKDIGVVGAYNTSWTEMLTPKLSSISVNEVGIAKKVAELIVNKATGEKIIIQPELIDRGSC